MSEWQPARVRRAHPVTSGTHLYAPRFEELQHKIVRVKPATQGLHEIMQSYRNDGCDGERFFEVHPEDCGCYYVTLCEHEVLTD